LALVADPKTGVAVYDSYNQSVASPWEVGSGTELGAAWWAGLWAIVQQIRADDGWPLLNSYGNPTQLGEGCYSDPYPWGHHNLDGHNGTTTNGLKNSKTYDEVTGLGTPGSPNGKADAPLAPSGDAVPASSAEGTLGGLLGYLVQYEASATRTTLHDSSTTSAFGRKITLTATVSAVAPGTGKPAGTVTFEDNGNPLHGKSTVALKGGKASFTISNLSVGSHQITVAYSGGGVFASSTSAVDLHAVTATTRTTIADLANAAQLADGKASFTISSLSVGSQTITAVYSGGGFGPSASAPDVHKVTAAKSKRLSARTRAIDYLMAFQPLRKRAQMIPAF
jgi:hypothetical protein